MEDNMSLHLLMHGYTDSGTFVLEKLFEVSKERNESNSEAIVRVSKELKVEGEEKKMKLRVMQIVVGLND